MQATNCLPFCILKTGNHNNYSASKSLKRALIEFSYICMYLVQPYMENCIKNHSRDTQHFYNCTCKTLCKSGAYMYITMYFNIINNKYTHYNIATAGATTIMIARQTKNTTV